MKEFLKSVVEQYKSCLINPDGSLNPLGLVDYLFVFPNRRSSLFFNQYLIEESSVPVFSPDMTTISELFPRLNDGRKLRILDRIELLFHLYDIYIKVSRSNETFDNFLFWGEMLIGDFNDADKYLVDAKLLFKNLKELKEIDEEFSGLEEDQIKIIKTFWKNFKPDVPGQNKEVFRQTWSVLYEIYVKFREQLLKDGAAYDGMFQRMIVEDLKQKEKSLGIEEEKNRLQCLLGKKVVFVGLTALSKTEVELMRHLNKYEMADFCWDYADERLNDKASHASYFKSSTVDVFPNAIDGDELKSGLVADKDKNFEVIEVPSGVGQTVQAANILQKWADEGVDALRTAVVLPDEKMLLPMLYSIPREYEPFNVTMGYSLKTTAIATFIDNIAHLQANIQKNKEGKDTFYYKNVLPLLASNYLTNLSDGKAAEISKSIVKNNKYRIPAETFKGNFLLESVFRSCGNGKSCIKYLSKILSILANQAERELEERKTEEESDKEDLFGEQKSEERSQGIFSEIEREFLYSYIKLVETLQEKLGKFKTDISPSTFFTLLHRLAQGETVAFTGEPLSGLQVMGVLETRDVDFDNLIILSMNEGVFPAKPLTNTFIPMNLRHAFGMPTQQHKDAVFAYHFYRLISRATNIVLLYDSRSEGMQSGEPSRYIKQLSYLYDITPKYKSVQYNIGVESNSPIVVRKDEHVMAKLRECLEGGPRKLSASVLKYYITCPLRFYFEFVEGLREEDEIEEGIDDKAFGSILHESMEKIYEKVKGRIVTPSDIDRVINDKPYLRRVIEECFHKVMKINDIAGYLHLVEEIILTYIIDILEHDKRLGDFHYIGSEEKETFDYQVKVPEGRDPLTVRIVAVYDRIDRLSNGVLRIVDYKTGKSKKSERVSKLVVPEISSVFSPDSTCSDEAFQVMLYALLYRENRISPNLYFVRDFHMNPELRTELKYAPAKNEPIDNFDLYKAKFRDAFDALICDIFDENKVFHQIDDQKHCKYCNFKDICKRD